MTRCPNLPTVASVQTTKILELFPDHFLKRLINMGSSGIGSANESTHKDLRQFMSLLSSLSLGCICTLNLWRLDISLHIFTDIAGCFHALHLANLYCKHVLHAHAVTLLSFPDHLRLSAIISARTARCIISRRSPRAVAGGGLLRPARCKL